MPENSKEEPNKNICRDITRERVVKVIEKKLENKEVGFEYKRVGQPIDAETILSGQLPTYKRISEVCILSGHRSIAKG
jgi:adenine-specific DNA-methyltransferase